MAKIKHKYAVNDVVWLRVNRGSYNLTHLSGGRVRVSGVDTQPYTVVIHELLINHQTPAYRVTCLGDATEIVVDECMILGVY